MDGTHIKANANLKKQAKKAVPKQAKRYTKELFEEVNKDREKHGKKPFSDDSDKKPPGNGIAAIRHRMAADGPDCAEIFRTFRCFFPFRSGLQTKNLLWLDCTSRFFYRLSSPQGEAFVPSAPPQKMQILPFRPFFMV